MSDDDSLENARHGERSEAIPSAAAVSPTGDGFAPLAMTFAYDVTMRLLLSLSFVLCLSWLCLRPAEAQPPPEAVTVRGKVTDRQTGAPVPNAKVILKPLPTIGIERQTWLNSEATTNDEGVFVLEKVEEGDYECTVVARGYHRHRQPRISVRASHPDPLNIVLDRGNPFLLGLPRRPPFPFGDLELDFGDLAAEILEEIRRVERMIFGDENGMRRAPRIVNGVPPAMDRGVNPSPPRPLRLPHANRPLVTFNLPPDPPRTIGRLFQIVTDERVYIVRMAVDDITHIDARTKVSMLKPGAGQGQERHLELMGNVNISLLRGGKVIVNIQTPRATLIENAQRIVVDARASR
ncbi:MAG: carboxypeptidase-like regulatory domain-containing protein [Abditibacteriales bacterium]|nr:carboxypeptidase-like regulatory domain-containing protein [Abditibacteriales bacterium]MDW8365736.1 carboxypeptidase-like regulatory domain-containing protein [Abditibacteriales bacterium]